MERETLEAVGVDMAHDIMADQLLPGLCLGVVDILRVGGQLVDLFLGDIQPQLPLRRGQGDPEPPPGAELVVLGEEISRAWMGTRAAAAATSLNMTPPRPGPATSSAPTRATAVPCPPSRGSR